MRGLFLGGVAAVALASGPAVAQDSYPALSGEVSLELQHDWVTDADDTTIEGHDTYATVETGVSLALTEAVRVDTGLTFEPVQDRAPDNDRLMDDHGLYVDTLQLVYEGEAFAVNAGKFTAPFGLAHDVVPGLFGDTFSAGYEMTERLGFGGAADLAVPDVATVSVAAALFKKDTTFLNRSLITDRDELDHEDGGSGNTEGLENVSLTLAAGDFVAVPGLVVQASFLRQGEGEGDAGATHAWAIGAAYEIETAGGVSFAPMIEYVRAEDAIGVNEANYIGGASESYLTAGVGVGYGGWSGALTGGQRTGVQSGQDDVEDHFFQVSAGYVFDNGVGFEAGWTTLEEGDQSSSVVAAKVAYGIAF